MAMATIRVLWHLARGGKGSNHQERLANFYGPQAQDYDSFRERLLHGRQELIEQLPAGGRLAEFGGGTGRNIEFFQDRIQEFEHVDIVDLCEPLLNVAKERTLALGWEHTETHLADVTTYQAEPYDCIYFSYSLSMIPNWWQAIENAMHLLKPGGTLGVVDFHVARKHPADGFTKHSGWTRTVWPLWFKRDGVHLREDLLPYLHTVCQPVSCNEGRGRLPLTPFRVPHFVFVGRKPDSAE